MQKVRVGIIGVGGIAQGVHLPQLLESPDAIVTAVCDIDTDTLNKVGDRCHIPQDHRFTDYHDLVRCPDVDAVEVCTPNNMHIPCAVAAVQAGKAINVEKPLALSREQALPLMELLDRNPVPNMMCFSYRFRPAVRYAKHLMEQGVLGRVFSIHVEYLKDSALWEGRRLDWRFVKEIGGSGVLGDLGAHLVDMARYLVGEFRSVSADFATAVPMRKRLDSEEYAPVTTDDYCHFIARMGEHADILANFTISRACIGNINTIRFDIYGEKGVLSFDLNHPDTLGVCVGNVDLECKALHTVQVPKKYSCTQEQTFIDAVLGNRRDWMPDIQHEGIACQKILDALLLSADEKRWVDLA